MDSGLIIIPGALIVHLCQNSTLLALLKVHLSFKILAEKLWFWLIWKSTLNNILKIYFSVHGISCGTVQKLWQRLWQPRRDRPHRSRWCCDNDVIADVTTSASEMAESPDQPCCSCVIHTKRAPCNIQHLDYNYRGDFEILHAASDYNTVNTKTSFICEEDDYFLSLSKDRRFLTPIPVSEL